LVFENFLGEIKMRMKKLDFIIAISFVCGVIVLIFSVIYRKNYLFYSCIALLAITIISSFAAIIMQKIEKRRTNSN